MDSNSHPATLDGVRVIVTGGSYEMGAATAAALADAGACVVALSRSGGVLDGLALADPHLSLRHDRCDVAIRAEVRSAFRSAVDWLGGLDVLIHAAGIVEIAPAETASDDSEVVSLTSMPVAVFTPTRRDAPICGMRGAAYTSRRIPGRSARP